MDGWNKGGGEERKLKERWTDEIQGVKKKWTEIKGTMDGWN